MHLSDVDIEKYREIHRKQYGEDISYEEAREQGTNLIGFMELLIEWSSKAEY